jgi:hypothetical protein
MSPEEFAKIYETCSESAIKIAVKKSRVTQEQAEDALQNAVCYLMENLDHFQEITPSYFRQLVVNRATSIVRSESARAANREQSVGDSGTLADVEEADYIRRKGRKLPVKPSNNVPPVVLNDTSPPPAPCIVYNAAGRPIAKKTVQSRRR